MVVVDFYYSIGSRYSYLAATQLAALEKETSCHIEWHPINSVKLLNQRQNSPFQGKPVSGQYEWSYRELDAKRWAELYRVPYLEPRGRVKFDAELLATACMSAKHFGKVVEFSHLLFSAMFKEPLSKIDEEDCLVRAEKCNIDVTAFLTILRDKAIASQLNENINKAYNAGVFGVPTFIVSGELFWGNDRLVLLRHYLCSHKEVTESG
jgi:2-hydroxychromene-2-carboxylate isomerase